MTDSPMYQATYLGTSSDYRTNRWRLKCMKCGYSWEPHTTRYACVEVRCDKCGTTFLVDYNKELDEIDRKHAPKKSKQ